MILAAAALGIGIGIGGVLGALGGGGAILTVPVLVYVIGQPVQEATTSSLVIVGITAATGMLGHARSGHVRWRTGLAFGVAGTAAAFAGSALNRRADADLLLLCFAGVMLIAAALLLHPRDRPAAGWAVAAGSVAVVERGVRAALVLRIGLAGLSVGVLTGLFGVGGGFVIVPALVLVLGLEMPEAVGTSLLVIVLNSAAALAARGGQAHVDWAVVVPFTVAAMAGTVAGKKVSDRLPAATLTRSFAVLLIAVAGYVAARSVLALT